MAEVDVAAAPGRLHGERRRKRAVNALQRLQRREAVLALAGVYVDVEHDDPARGTRGDPDVRVGGRRPQLGDPLPVHRGVVEAVAALEGLLCARPELEHRPVTVERFERGGRAVANYGRQAISACGCRRGLLHLDSPSNKTRTSLGQRLGAHEPGPGRNLTPQTGRHENGNGPRVEAGAVSLVLRHRMETAAVVGSYSGATTDPDRRFAWRVRKQRGDGTPERTNSPACSRGPFDESEISRLAFG